MAGFCGASWQPPGWQGALAGALVSGLIPAAVMFLRPPDPYLYAVSMGLFLLLTALQILGCALGFCGANAGPGTCLTVVGALSLAGFAALHDVLAVLSLILSLAGAVLVWLSTSGAHIRRSGIQPHSRSADDF